LTSKLEYDKKEKERHLQTGQDLVRSNFEGLPEERKVHKITLQFPSEVQLTEAPFLNQGPNTHGGIIRATFKMLAYTVEGRVVKGRKTYVIQRIELAGDLLIEQRPTACSHKLRTKQIKLWKKPMQVCLTKQVVGVIIFVLHSLTFK
jgi:hypothetical protein